MDTTQQDLTRLIAGHLQGTLTPEESDRLQRYIETDDRARGLLESFRDPAFVASGLTRLADFQHAADWDAVLARRGRRRRGAHWRWAIGTAATLALAVMIGWWMFQGPRRDGVIDDHRYGQQNDVLPGGRKATLTLADGSALELGHVAEGERMDGDASFVVSQGGLDYTGGNESARHVANHRLQVPVGGTYALTLADGTRVWVNSDSWLEFPTAFAANQRRVSMVGEAFFEIAEDAARPFVVQTTGMEIEALGTAFNVNTHLKAGSAKAILTEGKIRVSDGTDIRELTPGHSAVSTPGGLAVAPVDIEEALAWKDGYFYFNDKSMAEIVDELARWYGVTVDMQVPPSTKTYVGGIKRSSTLAAVCALLADVSDKQFTIAGKELVVHDKRRR